MKKITLALLACLSVGFVNASTSMDDEIYISSRDVMVGNNGIYVNLEGTIVEVEGIDFDEAGIHINPTRIRNWHSDRDACEQCEAAKKKKAEEERKRLEEEQKNRAS
jgi:hypothetical protein